MSISVTCITYYCLILYSHTCLTLQTLHALFLTAETFSLSHQKFHTTSHNLSADGIHNISNTHVISISSTGQPPIPGACFSGTGFLLARRGMRWRKGDTCLSGASCVTFSPPLAFACKLRGTSLKIISARERRLTGASPKPLPTQ